MKNTTDDATIERLCLARDRILEKLEDPATPAYSIAPLSNQLRLIDSSITRLGADPESEDGLPADPDDVGFIDLVAFGLRSSRPRAAATHRRRGSTAWSERYEEILDEWTAAGFVLPERSYREVDQRDRRAAIEAWIDECRTELARCLESHQPEDDQP
jgi:hypothetical protein